jgi:hypothetical protein
MDEFKKIAPPMVKEAEEAPEEGRKEQEAEEAPPAAAGGNRLKQFFSQRAISAAENEAHKNWESQRMHKSVTNEIVEYYPRLMLFHTIVVAMNAIRSPTDVVVVLTYFTILLRLLMVFGWYCQKRACVYLAAGAGEAFINIILFGITMAHSPF